MPEFLAVLALLVPLASLAQDPWRYPATRTVDVSDTYFGKAYPDPFRWLEDTHAPEAQEWFKAQAKLTDDLLARIPGRDALIQEWMELDKLKPASYSAFSFARGLVFYKKVLGGENVGKLYMRRGWSGAEKLVFDPATYEPGVTATIESAVPSWNGKHLVIGLSSGGAEYSELRVLDVEKGALMPERIYPSYGPYGWTPDGKAFLYDAGKVDDIKSPEIELHRKTRLHRLGTSVASDRELLSDETHPELAIEPKEFPGVSTDEANPGYLLASVQTVQNEMRVFYAPMSRLKDRKVAFDVLARTSDNLVRGLVLFEGKAYAVTYAGAPHYKVVRTSLAHPDWSKAETVAPEAADSVQSITRSRRFLFIVYSNGVTGRIVKLDPASGRSAQLALPGPGMVDIACPDAHSDRCMVTLTSWISPPTIYDYDAGRDAFTKSGFSSDIVYPGFENLVAEEVEVPGHDGVAIPLSIIRRKDLPLDGSAPAILEGYGAYGISYTPAFSTRFSVALRGVVLAYAHVRGGSEKGEAWYRAGFKTTKPNTWKDFISCADYLVAHRYTSPERLSGRGTSAGGILISRAITERPELFAAAVCNVGDCNAMRMEFTPNGPINTPEFGTVADPVEAQALYEMDGTQHVKPGVGYPAVLGVGGWNDPRVSVWEPGKFVAALQAASTSGRPVLMQVNYDDGHFTEEKIVTFRNFANQTAFVLWQSGHPDFQPAGAAGAGSPAGPAQAPAGR